MRIYLFYLYRRLQVAQDPYGKNFPWGPQSIYDMIKGDLLSKNGNNVSSDIVKNKIFGLYFSAHWCGPCRQFTPMLAEIYKKYKSEGKNFEIIFCSYDRENSQFNEYYDSMPWLSIPYGDDRIQIIGQEYQVESIPTLLLFDTNGKIISTDGRSIIMRNPNGFPWLPELINDLALNPTNINSKPCAILFEKGRNDLKESLKKIASEYKDDKLEFYYCEEENDVTNQIRMLTKTTEGLSFVITDIPDNGGYYKLTKPVNEESIKELINDYKLKRANRLQMS